VRAERSLAGQVRAGQGARWVRWTAVSGAVAGCGVSAGFPDRNK